MASYKRQNKLVPYDFCIRYNPFKGEGEKEITERLLYTLVIKRIKANKPTVWFIGGDSGEGKTQPEGSRVLMADGSWNNVEDIKVGDRVLSPQKDGSNIYSTVKETHTRYSKENYVICDSKRKYAELYKCSDNHLIPVYNRFIPRINGERLKENAYWRLKNYEARDFAKLGKDNTRNMGFSSFLINKYEGRDNFEIEPYSLGAFLGDGSFTHRRNTKYNPAYSNPNKRSDCIPFISRYDGGLSITSADPSIIEEVSKFYNITRINNKKGTIAKSYNFSRKGVLFDLLSKHGLMNKLSGDKFIPDGALYSNAEYRKRLLAGLIDTDGYYYHGGYSITTKSDRMAKNILDLVYSLGGRGNIRKVTKKITSINFKGVYNQVSFYLHDIALPLQTKRKRKSCDCSYKSSNRIKINVKLDKPAQVYGFTLDSPSGLYITDNWMVTHNSSTALTIEYILCRSMGINLLDYMEHMNVMHPKEYAEKLSTLLYSKDPTIKRLRFFCLHEARTVVNAKDWNSKLSKLISNVNAMSRAIKPICMIIISQFIKDIATSVRYTLTYYSTITRPLTGGYGNLRIYKLYKDDRDLEKPKIKKRLLQGYIMKAKRIDSDPLIENDWERVWTKLKSIKLHKPPKEIYEKFVTLDVAGKTDQMQKDMEEMSEQFKIEAGDENTKINKIANHYTTDITTLSSASKKIRGNWRITPEIRDMHNLNKKESTLVEDEINRIVKTKDWGKELLSGHGELIEDL